MKFPSPLENIYRYFILLDIFERSPSPNLIPHLQAWADYFDTLGNSNDVYGQEVRELIASSLSSTGGTPSLSLPAQENAVLNAIYAPLSPYYGSRTGEGLGFSLSTAADSQISERPRQESRSNFYIDGEEYKTQGDYLREVRTRAASFRGTNSQHTRLSNHRSFNNSNHSNRPIANKYKKTPTRDQTTDTLPENVQGPSRSNLEPTNNSDEITELLSSRFSSLLDTILRNLNPASSSWRAWRQNFTPETFLNYWANQFHELIALIQNELNWISPNLYNTLLCLFQLLWEYLQRVRDFIFNSHPLFSHPYVLGIGILVSSLLVLPYFKDNLSNFWNSISFSNPTTNTSSTSDLTSSENTTPSTSDLVSTENTPQSSNTVSPDSLVSTSWLQNCVSFLTQPTWYDNLWNDRWPTLAAFGTGGAMLRRFFRAVYSNPYFILFFTRYRLFFIPWTTRFWYLFPPRKNIFRKK